ncbi:PepSY domain-containing protein [Streptomyces sp. NPDC005931]|uniref:PepSY domain-containing protein n=1 Tax=Streptomyces sp. NPDC005931 TaxID=3364737 RepID=UPI003681F3DD
MKRNIVIAAVTAAALIGGGTATALAFSGDEAPTTRQTDVRAGDDDGRADTGDDRDHTGDDRARGGDDDADRDDARVSSADVTAAAAVAAALKHTPGTAVAVERDDAVWEVEVLGRGGSWTGVRVAPGSGKVLGTQEEDDADGDDTAGARAALKGTSVTAVQAAKAAAARGTVTSVELDDDGTEGWEAETTSPGGAERAWRIDPATGAVTPDRSGASDDD